MKRVGTKKDEGADIVIRKASLRRKRGESEQLDGRKERRRPKRRRAAGRFGLSLLHLRACSSRSFVVDLLPRSQLRRGRMLSIVREM